MKFRVYSKAPDAGWSSDWFWASNKSTIEHGPFPFKLWAWLAAEFASLRGDV